MQDSKAYPEWIIGYDPKMDHQYMIHTQQPRFICTIERHPFLSNADYLYENVTSPSAPLRWRLWLENEPLQLVILPPPAEVPSSYNLLSPLGPGRLPGEPGAPYHLEQVT